MNVLICPVVILQDPTSFFLSLFPSFLPYLVCSFSALDVKGGENLGGIGGVGEKRRLKGRRKAILS